MIIRGITSLALVALMQPHEPDIGFSSHAQVLGLCSSSTGQESALSCFSLLQRIEEMKGNIQETRLARNTRQVNQHAPLVMARGGPLSGALHPVPRPR
jgi:hypothetical protein